MNYSQRLLGMSATVPSQCLGSMAWRRRFSTRSEDRFVLIDGFEIMYRLYHVLSKPGVIKVSHDNGSKLSEKLASRLAHAYEKQVGAVISACEATHGAVVLDGASSRAPRLSLIDAAQSNVGAKLKVLVEQREKSHKKVLENGIKALRELRYTESREHDLKAESKIHWEEKVRKGLGNAMNTAAIDDTIQMFYFELGIRGTHTDSAGIVSQVAQALSTESEQFIAACEPFAAVQEFPKYKGSRTAAPEVMIASLVTIKELLANKIQIVCVDGIEADDIIGTLARSGANRGMDVSIVSSDKDFLQLLSPKIRILKKVSTNKAKKNKKDDAHVFPELRVPANYVALHTEWFKNAYNGLEPRQFVDVLALIGDKADSIPGVAGVGVKTAPRLIRKHGSVQGLVAGLDGIKSKRLRSAVAKHALAALLSRDLVQISCDIDLDLIDPCLDFDVFFRQKFPSC